MYGRRLGGEIERSKSKICIELSGQSKPRICQDSHTDTLAWLDYSIGDKPKRCPFPHMKSKTGLLESVSVVSRSLRGIAPQSPLRKPGANQSNLCSVS
jgi:hypothetical protein